MNKEYINQVVRKLKCSKKKRDEIKKQLLSDFVAELENGEKEQDIIKRMGKPTEIAEEFNSSFSDEEKKRYKKEKRTKRIGIIFIILVVVAGSIWWVLPKQKWIEDSEIYDKDTVLYQTEFVLECLEADNYEALKDISDETMATLLEGDDIIEAKSQIGMDWGERQSIGNTYVVEATQMGIKSAIVQMHVVYENESVMYTIFFNPDMELTGLWMQ